MYNFWFNKLIYMLALALWFLSLGGPHPPLGPCRLFGLPATCPALSRPYCVLWVPGCSQFLCFSRSTDLLHYSLLPVSAWLLSGSLGTSLPSGVHISLFVDLLDQLLCWRASSGASLQSAPGSSSRLPCSVQGIWFPGSLLGSWQSGCTSGLQSCSVLWMKYLSPTLIRLSSPSLHSPTLLTNLSFSLSVAILSSPLLISRTLTTSSSLSYLSLPDFCDIGHLGCILGHFV